MSLDFKIMIQLKNKSQDAFKELYEKYYRLVFYQSFLILNSRSDAEDVTQNVFIKFYSKIDELPIKLNIKNYIVMMAKNSAIDQYRKNKIEPDIVEADDYGNEDNINSDEEILKTFHKILEPEECHILILRLNFDYTFKEISKELNQSLNTIQAKYYKGLKKVKAYYSKEN